MAKKFLRSFASIVSLFLASCKGPSPELTVEDISIYVESDANHNSALATDLVIVYSEELVKSLEKMSACTYFATTKQLLMDNPTLLDIWHWEFVPGQSVQNFSPCGGRGRAFAAFVFANYLTSGEHRLKVSPDGVVKIILGKEDLKDLSKARLQDMKLGATMSKPEDFCPSTNPEFNKWSTLGEAISADVSDNGVKKGPITAHCPTPRGLARGLWAKQERLSLLSHFLPVTPHAHGDLMAQLNMNPIQWYEGMLLMPQHFQQADMRLEALMTYYTAQAFPFYWGKIQFKIDESLLTSGIFRPLMMEVIMPDGLSIGALPQTATPLQIDLSPFQEKLEASPYFIYLCVPERHGDWTDVGGDLPRYLSVVGESVLDINTGKQAIEMPRLTPNLSLQIGQEPPAHYVSLPLAQVSYDTKSFSLTPYIAPQVRVELTSELGQICNGLVLRLREKLGYLQQKVQAIGGKDTDDPFYEEMEAIRLKLVVGLIPFEVVLLTGKSHPFEVYKALCTLAAHLSGIKYGEIPPRFKGYDHLNLREAFSEVVGYIQKLLEEIEESYTVVSFTLTERAFTLQLESSWIGDRFVLGAQAQPGMSDEDLLNWINNCVIVTDKYITLAKDTRVLGANRTIVAEIPSMNLVAVQGIKLFVVDADRRYIDPKGVLCLFNVSDNDETRPARIVLYNATQ